MKYTNYQVSGKDNAKTLVRFLKEWLEDFGCVQVKNEWDHSEAMQYNIHYGPLYTRFEISITGNYDDEIVVTIFNTEILQNPCIYEIVTGPDYDTQVWLGKHDEDLAQDLQEALEIVGD